MKTEKTIYLKDLVETYKFEIAVIMNNEIIANDLIDAVEKTDIKKLETDDLIKFSCLYPVSRISVKKHGKNYKTLDSIVIELKKRGIVIKKEKL